MSGEDDLIARYFKPIATDPGALGLTDDAAVLKGSGDDLVITTDAIVEGVHFRNDDPPETVARKALRVNLSDLAAKGATPAGFVLTLALRELDERWLAAFANGFAGDAIAFDCPLLGGDTVATPGPLTISVTAFGRVPRGEMILRSRAQPGDRIAVSGGSATVDAAAVPFSEAARGLIEQGQASFASAVSGGDDYEILCTVARDRWDDFARAARVAGVAVTPIGEVVAGDAPPKWRDAKGDDIALAPLSYSHF